MPHHETGDSSVLTALFKHNVWANLKLLDFCEGLSDEQLDPSAIGGFGTIRDTLQHIVGAEVSYVNRVNDRMPAQTLKRDEPPSFALMKEAVRWAGDELVQLATSATSDSQVRQRPPRREVEYPLAGLMVQVINHATEHRAQIAAIITQLGMEPPDMSGWSYMEESGEIKELGAGTTA